MTSEHGGFFNAHEEFAKTLDVELDEFLFEVDTDERIAKETIAIIDELGDNSLVAIDPIEQEYAIALRTNTIFTKLAQGQSDSSSLDLWNAVNADVRLRASFEQGMIERVSIAVIEYENNPADVESAIEDGTQLLVRLAAFGYGQQWFETIVKRLPADESAKPIEQYPAAEIKASWRLLKVLNASEHLGNGNKHPFTVQWADRLASISSSLAKSATQQKHAPLSVFREVVGQEIARQVIPNGINDDMRDTILSILVGYHAVADKFDTNGNSYN